MYTNNIDRDLLQILHGLLIEIDEEDELTNLSQDVINKTHLLKETRMDKCEMKYYVSSWELVWYLRVLSKT